MTLHVYEELEQGTDAWLAARCGLITASTIGRLITVGIVGAAGYGCPDCGADTGQPCISKASKTPKPISTHHPARVVAARSGREPDTLTAHDARETDDGFVEHRALFTVKELDR